MNTLKEQYATFAIEEAKRLRVLLEKSKEQECVKEFMLLMGEMLEDREGKTTEIMTDYKNFRNARNNYVETKIEYWKNMFNWKEDLLDRLNETMDEWLQTAWIYLGQEHIRSDSDNAMYEMKMFRGMIEKYNKKEVKEVNKKRKGKNGRKARR